MGDESQDTPTAVAVQLVLDPASGWKVGLAYCDNTLKVNTPLHPKHPQGPHTHTRVYCAQWCYSV